MAVTWKKLAYEPDVILASLLTTLGDLIRRGVAAPERVALGANGYVLSSDGTDAVWAVTGGTAILRAFAAAQG